LQTELNLDESQSSQSTNVNLRVSACPRDQPV
jgi:hypothetical protein